MSNGKGHLLTAGLVAVCAFALGGATMVVAQSGTTIIRAAGSTITAVKTATANGDFLITGSGNGVAAKDVPRARHQLVLTKPSGTLVVARFVAPVACSGDPGRVHAQVRVHDNNNGDAVVATMPYIGHLDSSHGGEAHESHGIESSITLPPGNYDFQVRLTLFSPDANTLTCHLPHWHYTVERID